MIKITAYSDAVYVSSFVTKSTTGCLVYVGNNVISCENKKEKVTTLSPTEYQAIPVTEKTLEII